MKKVPGSGFRVQGSEFRVQSSAFRVQRSAFRVQGSRVPGFRVCGFKGLRVHRFTGLRVYVTNCAGNERSGIPQDRRGCS